MRDKFNEQLDILNAELTQMGELVEKAIDNAVKALMNHDSSSAEVAIAFDREIDQKEKDIESICFKLLLHQQPVATDLRVVSSALKMITDMERIGDMASDISEIAAKQKPMADNDNTVHVPKMAQETIHMVKEAVRAFVLKDQALACKVIAQDDVVDGLFITVKEELARIIVQDQTLSSSALDTLMVAKYFERVGDHATNIAEWVRYSITGEHL